MAFVARSTIALAAGIALGAGGPGRPVPVFEEHAEVTRGIVIVRADPKRGAPPAVCDDLSKDGVEVSIGGRRVAVTSVERVPRPDRHWLLLDISGSAEGRRNEAKRSAAEYVREVMTPGLDAASLLTVDEDTVLLMGPTSDTKALAERIDAVPAGGWSGLRDTLADVLRQIEGDRHEHLVLYWTDGQDNQSLTTPPELLTILAGAPNATVFPIALLPARRPIHDEPVVGSFLFDVARRSGAEVFASSDPRWLDRVRGWIARRFTISVAPPEGAAAGPIAVTLRDKRCVATILPDPFASPDPVAGASRPPPADWLRLYAKQRRKTDDPACVRSGGPAPWDWPLDPVAGGVEGCMLDLVEAPGPLVSPRDASKPFGTAPARFALRRVRVEAPALSALASSLDDAQDEIVSAPVLVEGSAFLTQRARIAASLFATRPDYHDFAIARLRELAEVELRAIERDFAHAFPGLPRDEIAAIARDSRAGRRALLATQQPTDADLARVLASWLRDRPALEVVIAWERRLIERHLAGRGTPGDAARWTRARDRLAVPSQVRIIAPLVALRDPARGALGFERIVLPRPEGFFSYSAAGPAADDAGGDQLPSRPLGLWLADRLLAAPEIGKRLKATGYVAAELAYAPRDSLPATGASRPARRKRITLTLVAPGAPARAEINVEIEDTPGDSPRVTEVSVRVTGDDELARLLRSGLVPRIDGPDSDRASDP